MAPGNKKGTLYIPQTIKLPGPFIVKVKQLKPMQMKEKHGEIYDGIWDVGTMTVDINKMISHKRKWYVFSHEYAHVLNDWMLFLVNNGIAQG